jgi:hypothetical protein
MTRWISEPYWKIWYRENAIEPVLFAAIHAGEDRKLEYGTQRKPDYLKRGAKAPLYTSFIFDELIRL